MKAKASREIRKVSMRIAACTFLVLVGAASAHAADAPKQATEEYRIDECANPVRVRVHGIPAVGRVKFDATLDLCGSLALLPLSATDDTAPPQPLPAEQTPKLALTMRQNAVDVRVELPNGNTPLTYEAKDVPLDARNLPLKTAANGPPLTLSVKRLTDVDHVGLNVVDVPAKRLLDDLIRIKHLNVRHPERIGNAKITFRFRCIAVPAVMQLLAEVSGVESRRDAKGGFLIARVKNSAAIEKLRSEALGYPPEDKARLKLTLQRIIALSQPGDADEIQEFVGSEYAQLAAMATEEKDYAHAEQYYRAELAQVEQLSGKDDPDYAIVLGNVADARSDQHDRAGARKIYERALALLEKHPGPDALPASVEIIDSLESIAVEEKSFDEAIALGSRAYARLTDPDHDEWTQSHLRNAQEMTSTMEEYLGHLLDARDAAAAEVHYERALKLKEERFGEDSPQTDSVRAFVILNAEVQKKTERAGEYLERQVAVLAKRPNRDADAYARNLNRLIDIRADQGNIGKVIPLWQQVIDLRRNELGDNSPQVVAGLRDLATLYRLNQQWTEAAAAEQRAAAIKPAEAGPAALSKLHASMKSLMQDDTAKMLICATLELQKPADDPLPKAHLLEQQAECELENVPALAMRHLERSLRIRIDAQGVKHADTHHTADRLIELYEKAGDQQSADRFRALIKD